MGFLQGFGWPHLLILVLLVVVLFGAKKLPGAARGIGQSMRIFKAEMAAGKDARAEDTTPPTPPQQLDAAAPPVVPPVDQHHQGNVQP